VSRTSSGSSAKRKNQSQGPRIAVLTQKLNMDRKTPDCEKQRSPRWGKAIGGGSGELGVLLSRHAAEKGKR